MKTQKTIVRIFIILFVFGLSFITLFFGINYLLANSIALDESLLKKNFDAVSIFDDDGEIISNGSEYSFTQFSELGKNTVDAFVSIEDRRFFEHNGVDYIRIVKATIKNILSFSFKEGASTISQQLVKNTILSREKTIIRKIKEINLAKRLEKKYSKEEILSMYLSAIYFGDGVYGIKNAAKHYFNKATTELSVDEAATLAAIVKAPSYYSPTKNPDKANARRNVVLKAMAKNGKLAESEYSRLAEKATLLNVSETSKSSGYITLVENEAAEILKEKNLSGYKIYTFFDNFDDKLETVADETYNGCNIVLNKDGKIIYFSESVHNLMNKRTNVASLIKPLLVYAPAIEENVITPATIISDEKRDYGGYSPSNYKDMYYGKVTIRQAVTKSLNTVAVSVFNSTGKYKTNKYAKRLGIELGENDGLAAALGATTNGITPLEIASCYSVFQNGGEKSSFSSIKKIVDDKGKTVFEYSQKKECVFSAETAYIISSMLFDNAKIGTAKKLAKSPYTLYAKTGTNGNDKENYDSWCIAFNGKYIVLSYLSGTEGKKLPKNLSGGTIPTENCKNIFDVISNGKDYPISQPQTVKKVKIDGYIAKSQGKILLAAEETPEKYVIEEYFAEEKIPKEVSNVFLNPYIEKAELSLSGNEAVLKFPSRKIYRYVVKNFLTDEVLKEIDGKDGEIELSLGEFENELQVEVIPSVIDGKIGIGAISNAIYKKDRLII